MKKQKMSFTIGDLNINILEENNSQVDLYETIMADSGFKSLVNESTRFNLGTCID